MTRHRYDAASVRRRRQSGNQSSLPMPAPQAQAPHVPLKPKRKKKDGHSGNQSGLTPVTQCTGVRALGPSAARAADADDARGKGCGERADGGEHGGREGVRNGGAIIPSAVWVACRRSSLWRSQERVEPWLLWAGRERVTERDSERGWGWGREKESMELDNREKQKREDDAEGKKRADEHKALNRSVRSN